MRRLLAATIIAAFASGVAAEPAPEWTLDRWVPPYEFATEAAKVNYSPLTRASKPWKLCVLFPHLKDAYWVATNYGVIAHARRIGVTVDLFEAGGYGNIDKQRSQLDTCVKGGYDAILVGSVSFDGLTPAIVEAAKTKPIFATVNQVLPAGLSGMAAVNWIDMGRSAGRYFAERFPKGRSRPVKIAWLPGPETAGWVKLTDQGFREEIEGAAVEVVAIKYGDTGADVQLGLVQDVLEEYPDIDFIAGNAVAIEAAMALVRQRGLKGKVGLVADYFTPAIYRGIRRGIVAGAPTDSAALQGTLSVDQAVRFLEGNSAADHVGPIIFNVTAANVRAFPRLQSLAPPDFQPTYSVQ
ncbi:TMAO reductase system periplasmic protein TorT [Acuticoccus sp. MNP-M23]|uniref:TMAO reductase system periplasmic protein TorT n=1 Tax=Acuticoccus sp. MNP-M23 TaxID=3072793 RepID=UPI00281501EF|nr:TMAO reductase system periplasmic protein TorT [Acuticoccus sp. MNP-M23]WMS42599.1 TMAO reductase system periplasmic protein TorT [Acuticoccus sp. MNP-M23]